MPLKEEHSGAGRRWLGRLGLPLCAVLPLLVLAVGLQPARDTQAPVTAIFPPTYSSEETLAALGTAGALLVAPGGFGSVFIVQSDAPDFTERLYRAGAWFLLRSDAAWCQPVAP